MTKGEIAGYRMMNKTDQRAIDAWVKANFVVGSLFSALVLIMALASFYPFGFGTAQAETPLVTLGPGPAQAETPRVTFEPGSAQAETPQLTQPLPQGLPQTMSPLELMSVAPRDLPIQQVVEPF